MGENKKAASSSLRIHLCHAQVHPNHLTLLYRGSCGPYVQVIYVLPAGSRRSNMGFDGGVLSKLERSTVGFWERISGVLKRGRSRSQRINKVCGINDSSRPPTCGIYRPGPFRVNKLRQKTNKGATPGASGACVSVAAGESLQGKDARAWKRRKNAEGGTQSWFRLNSCSRLERQTVVVPPKPRTHTINYRFIKALAVLRSGT